MTISMHFKIVRRFWTALYFSRSRRRLQFLSHIQSRRVCGERARHPGSRALKRPMGDISARGAKALATALKDEDGVAGKWLTWLDLKYNDLGEEGEAAVREAIEVVAERYEAEIDPDLRELEL